MRSGLLLICLIVCFLCSASNINALSEEAREYYVCNNQVIYCNDILFNSTANKIDSYFVDDNHPLYKSVDGVLYSKDGTKLIAYPSGNTRQSYRVINTCSEIGPYAFYNSHLNYVEFPPFDISNVKTIGEKAFYGCRNLLQICLPSSIERVGEDAFGNCGKSLIVIVEKNSCCCQCPEIQHLNHIVTVNDYYDVMEWESIFSEIVEYPSCLSMDNHYQVIDGVLFQDDVMLAYPSKKNNEEYMIPNGTITVLAHLFQNEYIKRLFIPASCISIQDFVQSADGQLEHIDVETDNPEYASVEGVLYSKDHSILLCCPKNINLPVFCPPNGVKTIAPDSCQFCKCKKMVLPDGVQSIELFAFYGSLLEEFVIPETVVNLEMEAFENCSHLKYIYLRKGSYADEVLHINASDYFENFIGMIKYF